MIQPATRVAVLVALVLIPIGCGGSTARPPLKLSSPGLGSVLKCESWTDVAEWGEPTPGVEKIDVIIHVMLATIDRARRKQEYSVHRAWALAPVEDAVKLSVENVLPEERGGLVEYWTPHLIRAFFGPEGKVNAIWTDYHRLIQLRLRGFEDCRYYPGVLRPDGLVRDSMLTPQTSTLWSTQLFRSINRLFADEYPNVLHVFLWWSVAEGDIDGVNAASGKRQRGDSQVWGYSRSAARGGPAVWIGAHTCLTPAGSEEITETHGRCAKVIAHEVGHALGLHHVEDPYIRNLMFEDPGGTGYVDESERGLTLSPSQKEQALREAREQFRPR